MATQQGTQSHCPVSLPSFHGTGESYRHATTISMLPDNVLLQIFDFYRSNSYSSSMSKLNPNTWTWHVLVHVCQTWRQVVFASPHRLHLRILCTHRTPVRKILDIWPPFPIVIDYHETILTPNDEENVIATLTHPDRVCFVRLDVTRSQWGRVNTMMQESFPVLKHLVIFSRDGSASVLPAGFLGGSAPCLQTFDLHDIPFPTLPTLLLSTSDLVTLSLNIPPTGYILPEAMAASLAALPRLETFSIEFQSATPHPDRILPPRVTRAVLPALTSFDFTGAIEYLDDLITQIDGPRLKRIFVDCLNLFFDLQVAQISQFINRSVGPKLTPLRHAQITFFSDGVSFDMNGASYPHWDRHRATILSHGRIYWQASHMAQVLSQFSATLYTVVHLELELDLHEDDQLEGMVDVEWLHLFRQFPNVQTLCVSWQFAVHIALALGTTTGSMNTEVLPFLHLICLQNQPASSVEKFITARRLSGHPVTVIDTYIEYAERLASYVGK